MPAANESLRYFADDDDLTYTANSAVTGCRFLGIKANKDSDGLLKLSHTSLTAGQSVVGVSAYDVASGARGLALRHGEVQVLAGEALAAGDDVYTTATGTAVKLATVVSGIRLGTCTTAASNGALATILLTL